MLNLNNIKNANFAELKPNHQPIMQQKPVT